MNASFSTGTVCAEKLASMENAFHIYVVDVQSTWGERWCWLISQRTEDSREMDEVVAVDVHQ